MKASISLDEMRSRCRAVLKAYDIKRSTAYDYQLSLASLIFYMKAKENF
jgi:hypothetical protein